MAAEGRGEEIVRMMERGVEFKRSRGLVSAEEPATQSPKHRSDDVSENLKHKDGQQEQDDSMPKKGGNQGSPSKKRKTAPTKKNSTSKSVTNKGGYVSQSSTSKSKSQGLSGRRTCLMARAEPSQAEMLAVISDMVRTADFDHTNFNDILKELEAHFNINLSHWKAEVRSMIEEVISNMTDSDEEEEEEEEEEESDDRSFDEK